MRMNVYAENCGNSKLLEVWGGMSVARELQRCLKTKLMGGGEGAESVKEENQKRKCFGTYRIR